MIVEYVNGGKVMGAFTGLYNRGSSGVEIGAAMNRFKVMRMKLLINRHIMVMILMNGSC